MGLLTLFKGLKRNTNQVRNKQSRRSFFEEIPKDILEMLWFKDGEYKNYNEKNDKKVVDMGSIKLTISSSLDTEPSLISVFDIIKESDRSNVETPGYYPSYKGLNPEQRWIYVNWLREIDSEIDISYVFIFYYGLERHLLSGDYSKAWKLVKRLRKFHKNKSFIAYSTDALIASSIIHNRPDLFIELLQDTEEIDDIVISDLYLFAKYRLFGEITPKEIMKIASSVGFKNNRYIKNDELVFENELISVIQNKFNKNTIELSKFNLDECEKKVSIIVANCSIDSNQRQVYIPSLVENMEFRELVYDLLNQAHEATKQRLKEIRKSGVYVPATKKQATREAKKPDKVFYESEIFRQIDVNMFDKNRDFYNNYICPYCKDKIEKMPVAKGKCPKCKNDILVKNSVFTGEKIAITIDENKVMVEVRNERARRNFINGIILEYQLDFSKIKNKVTKNNIIEKVLIVEIEKIGKYHKKNGDLGLYRNTLLRTGNINERIGNLDEALKLYMAICYYDLNGASNSGMGFDKRFISLAPGIIDLIQKIVDKLDLDEISVYNTLREVIKEYKEPGMFVRDNLAWDYMKEAIYNDILEVKT